ncbi:hypothetical protein SAMN05421595_1210 [Austwickia chelonae]|nr:hypothetical protein SAMN05421595_1210 [Austwickia chelonae]
MGAWCGPLSTSERPVAEEARLQEVTNAYRGETLGELLLPKAQNVNVQNYLLTFSVSPYFFRIGLIG